jgi:hypothetical protein
VTSPEYAFTFPRGWGRLNLAIDLDTEIERFLDGVPSLNRQRDARNTVLTRRRAKNTYLAICSQARHDGVLDLFVFSSAAGPSTGPMCLSVLPVVTHEAHPGVSPKAEVARSIAGPTSLLSSMSTSQGDVARVLDRWTVSAAQWARTTELALARLGIASTTDLSSEQRQALEEPLETARVHYIVDVPERRDCVLLMTFIATGGAFLSPQLAHADDIVHAFRWTMPARTRTSSTSAENGAAP